MSHSREHQSAAGRARATSATRGSAGQFIPAGTQPQPATSREGSISSKSVRGKPLTLKCLPLITDWWDALAEQYPGVNLHAELLKAMDWHRADQVKSPKLFFRNWVERTSLSAPRVDLTPEQIRARLRVV